MSKRIDQGLTVSDLKIDFTNSDLIVDIRLIETATTRDLAGHDLQLAEAAHADAQISRLEASAAQLELESTESLLSVLGDESGFSWATVARCLAVTPTAVRKWRRGDEATPANHQSVAHLVAFVRQIQNLNPLANDVSHWLEMPVYEKSSFTRVDLYRRGAYSELMDLATGRTSGRDTLEKAVPDWRDLSLDNGRSEVVWNDDGTPSIVQKDE